MAITANATTVIANFGSTPGFKIEEAKGSYRLIRLPIHEYSVPLASIKMSPHAQAQQLKNAITRMRRIGWTQALYEECKEISERHRKNRDSFPTEEAADAAAAAEHQRALLRALGIDPNTATSTSTKPVPAPRKRHGTGGTATGSAKAHVETTAAAPAPPEDTSAPIVVASTTMTTRVEVVSPERALDLIANMAPYQRDVKKQKVTNFAAAMQRKEWVLNPADHICIDTNGKTANGQHRLHAVFESNTTQEFWFTYGVDPEAYRVMDRGTKRTTADMLQGAGEKYTTSLASVAKLAHLWFNVDQDQWKSTPEVTEAQIFAVLEAHPGLRDAVREGRIGGRGVKCSPTGSMFAHYLITRKMGGDSRTVTAWYRAIQEMDLAKGQPGHTLGMYFMKTSPAASRRTTLAGRTQRELDMYLIIQAWNNTCQGKEMRSIGWKPDFVIANPLTPGPNHKFPDPQD